MDAVLLLENEHFPLIRKIFGSFIDSSAYSFDDVLLRYDTRAGHFRMLVGFRALQIAGQGGRKQDKTFR